MLFRTLALSLTLLACAKPIDPADIPSGVPVGRAAVAMDTSSDGGIAETAVDEVWLRFEDVLIYHEDQGWISIGGDRQDIDLTSLIDGAPATLASADVYEGPYNTVRLIVADSWVVVDGAEEELRIQRFLDLPGDGYDFSADFSVTESMRTTATLSWNLDTELTESGGVWTLGTTITPDVAVDPI